MASIGTKKFGESSVSSSGAREEPFSLLLSVQRATRLTVGERAFIAETKTRIVKHARIQTRGGARTHAREERRGGRRDIAGSWRLGVRGIGGDGPRGEEVRWDGTIDRVALVASGSKKSRRAKSDGCGR